MALRLSRQHRAEIVEHCLSAAPNEGCGLFAVLDCVVTRVYPTANAEASPTRFTVPPDEHFAALSDAESQGWELGGVFHSHPSGEARPSMTDVRTAVDPEWIYLVVGLEGLPEVRAWRIKAGEMTELTIA